MVIKAVVASAAAATPATPSTLVRSATTAATATVTVLDLKATYPSFVRYSPCLVSPWRSTAAAGGVRWYRARPSYGVATPGSVPYDPKNKTETGQNEPDNEQQEKQQLQDKNVGLVDGIVSKSPFIFETGFAVYAKRPSRAFPPPFMSPPSSSFSEPLSTHDLSQDKRLRFRGERIRALTNGDDAVLASQNFLGVNDGVGAWATRPRGHAALWSRLLLHFWALHIEREVGVDTVPDPVEYLQQAYEETVDATTSPNEWYGTTTSVTALLHAKPTDGGGHTPVVYITNLGDCKVLVIRPREEKILFETKEQWHWFDCPMQLGTNSVDTPRSNAAMSEVQLEEGDIVLALSDGVVDNLWDQELLAITVDTIKRMEETKQNENNENNEKEEEGNPQAADSPNQEMVFVAREVLKAALSVAQDPFAESPYMEKAIDEGMAIEGGKMDDISVVVGRCKKRGR